MSHIIYKKHFYYPGTLVIPPDDYVKGIYGLIIEFDTKEEAQEWINDISGGDYMLSHGEYARPEYEIHEVQPQ